jgi:hypothetical protein
MPNTSLPAILKNQRMSLGTDDLHELFKELQISSDLIVGCIVFEYCTGILSIFI